MMDFNTIKEKATVQLQDEWNKLQDTLLENPDSQRLADAIMNLRSLSEDSKFTLSEILCDTVPVSFLEDFRIIFNVNEFSRLSSALDSLITQLRYSILDDGYIRIFKAVIEEDLCIGGKKIERSKLKFFLTTDEDSDPIELTVRKVKQNATLGYLNPKLVSVKRAYFGQAEKFTRMLEVFGDKNNWDMFDFIGEDKLEPLLCFHELKELLDKPVHLKS